MKNNIWYIIGGAVIVVLIVIIFIVNSNKTSEFICNTPYILVGSSCCLDKNDNNVCDSDESSTQQSTSSQNAGSQEKAQEQTPTPVCKEEEVENIALSEKGTLGFGTAVIVPDGWKMQEKQLCFNIPSGKSTMGTLQFSSPIWFMINTEENVNCQVSGNCGFDLGYATGSQITSQTFDFGWTGNNKLCLSMSGFKANDVPITYDVLIKTYSTETICS